ncbi:EthD domain-containing protein [Sphingomonas sp. CARO-RG-8B-R24-01]|uniref:EthD domain-containing protein n=1 Tax=Sphingomonas sp. CARO-RG-8B-R24-01 TaxID=2914831 RepID=UPI001F5818FD|nr:EthD domain-containing protein [Sphingomonas sp. CARO-RG-8B-R24-01]
MAKLPINQNYAERDASIAINSYTTVLRRPRVPHDLFATYWRDVHGPLCSRIPGLGWYVQNHFDREQDAHLWPPVEGITPFPDYELDGGVEIGFASAADQATFNDASHILFADEQNMFEATVAYALPDGSQTLVDRIPDALPNADDGFDRIHVHLGAAGDDLDAFGTFLRAFAAQLAAEPAVLKVRLHLPDRYDNANPAPPAPNVDHLVPPERAAIAILELAFETPLTRRAFLESDAFRATEAEQRRHIRHATAFAVSGVYTYVRDKTLTLAGLRGSRPAQLIERLGANNQTADDVRQLILSGKP